MRQYSFTFGVGIHAKDEEEAIQLIRELAYALRNGTPHVVKVDYVDADDFEDHG